MALPAWSIWFFRISCLVVALAVLRVLMAPLALVMPDIAYYFPERGFAASLHIIGGPLALALAPFQLSESLRRRYTRLHRLSGYVYGLAILLAGLGSMIMLPHFRGALSSATGFAVLGLLWITFTARGIWFAVQKNIVQHRRYMLRSVALTFAAVTLRIMMIPLIASGWTSTETYLITAWASWMINLAFVEFILLRNTGHAGAGLYGFNADVRPVFRHRDRRP